MRSTFSWSARYTTSWPSGVSAKARTRGSFALNAPSMKEISDSEALRICAAIFVAFSFNLAIAITIAVPDVDACAAFYRDFGLTEVGPGRFATTDELIARGGFGTPTFFIDRDDLYFGNDRFELMQSALNRKK